MASAPPRATGAPGSLPSADASGEIRSRALRRLVIAVALLAAAFGALLTYERFSTPRTVAPGARPAAAPSPAAGAPGTPIEAPTAAEAGEPAAAQAAAEEPPPGPEPATGTGTAASAAATPAASTGAKPAPPPPEVINSAGLPAGTPGPAARAPRADPAPARSAAGALPVPAPAPPAPAGPLPSNRAEAPRGYVVQLGVFGSTQNAEALQRKLAEAGVTTTTETRVLIGPFRDRADAERSLEVVKKLGLGAVVMPAR